MESTPTLKTARLLLTLLQLEDAPAIQQLFPHWEVVRQRRRIMKCIIGLKLTLISSSQKND